MGFTLQIAQDLIEVEAGGNSPVTIVITNTGTTADRYEIEIEGLDIDWKAIPVPVFTADPGETRSERAFFKPPRASESGAGNYPFVVNVRSLESGEQRSVQGVLRLKPFHYLTLEITPKKGVYSWSTHRNRFEVNVTNLGNTEHTLQLVGGDPEDDCAYEFDHDRLTIGPGQQKEITVEVRPVSSPVLSGSKLIGFSIHARSVDVPSVVASGQAQLERRSLLSPANLTILILFLGLCLAWYLMKPKPPGVDISLSAIQGLPGDKVILTWSSHDSDHLQFSLVDPAGVKQDICDDCSLQGSAQLTLGSPGTETIFAYASKGGIRAKDVTKTITVNPPAPLIVPKILSFSPAKREIRGVVPFDVVFNFKLQDAVGAGLTPDFPNLDPGLESISVSITSATDKTYQLVAWSKDHQYVRSQEVRVIGVERSDANIVSFTASAKQVPLGGPVLISWNVTGAAQIGIKHDGTLDSSLAPADTKTYTINHDTTFVLVCADAKNRIATQKIVVKLQQATSPPQPSPGGPTDGTGLTGGTTGVVNSAPPTSPSSVPDSGSSTTAR
jgi:hypothetical protein